MLNDTEHLNLKVAEGIRWQRTAILKTYEDLLMEYQIVHEIL